MHITTEAAREIAADTRKIIYPHGRVRQLAADLVSEREKVAELEAALAEARKDGERWRWWMADYKRDIAGLFDGVAQGWSKAQWDDFVDGKIAAAAAEREKE